MRTTVLHSAVVATLLAAAPALAYELQRFTLEGRLHAPGGTRAASLNLLCHPDPDGGAISLELVVPQAGQLKDFDYGDFEGPDAAVGNHDLSRVSVSGDAGKTEIAYAAGGWYGVDPPDSFVFSLSQPSHRRGRVATLVGAVGSAAGTQHLVWVQTGFDDPKRELRAAFDFDAASAKRFHDTVAACLPNADSAASQK